MMRVRVFRPAVLVPFINRLDRYGDETAVANTTLARHPVRERSHFGTLASLGLSLLSLPASHFGNRRKKE